jgi:predicted nuclease of predicted toxin-antitoxin system
MKLLLDENLPVKLKFRLLEKGLDTYTVVEKKWNAKQNGELLLLMLAEEFTHLVTFDSHLSFQQNFIKYPIPVIAIIANSNDYDTIMNLFDELIICINGSAIGPNSVIHPSRKTK